MQAEFFDSSFNDNWREWMLKVLPNGGWLPVVDLSCRFVDFLVLCYFDGF